MAARRTVPVAICPPALVTHRPGAESGTRFAGEHSPRSPPSAQPPPRPVARAPFVGFPATMAESGFSCPFIIGYGSSPSQRDPATRRALPVPHGELRHMPGSKITRGRNRPRGFARSASPSDTGTSAPGIRNFRGSMAGLCLPLPTLRRRPRDRQRTAWGPVWCARPSP
jgi:hypothetical protein